MISTWAGHKLSLGSIVATSADYIITNDGDAITANSFANILALGAATLSGKRIAIQPLAGGAAYTPKTISLTGHAQPIIFEAGPSGTPVIDQIVLNNTNKLTFRGIKAVSSAWPASINPVKPCVAYSGTVADIIWEQGCEFKGSYRSDWTVDIDALTEYPEYASIIPQFAADGTLASLLITAPANPYVGDLMADGTYSLAFTSVSATPTFTTFPQATMTVAGGYITATNITNVGASNATTAINTSTGILSKVVSWAGQKRMIEHLPYGHQGVSLTSLGSVKVLDCRFRDLNNGFKVTSTTGALMEVKRCDFDRTYQDTISLGLSALPSGTPPMLPPPVEIEWNTFRRCLSRAGDPGDPHADTMLQTFAQDLGTSDTWTNVNWTGIRVVGNIVLPGATRSNSFQLLFISESPANGFAYEGAYIVGNIGLNVGSTIGIAIDNMKDSYIAANTIVRADPAHVNNLSAVSFRFGLAMSYGTNAVLDNIFESETVDNQNNIAAVDRIGNVFLGTNGLTIPYATAFTGPTFAPISAAEAINKFTPKAEYASKGAIRPGYIDHAARTINLAMEPSHVSWASLTGQATSTAVSSAWRKIVGGPDTITFACSGGATLQYADNDAGLNASVAAANGSFPRGKFVRLNITTSANGSTSVTGSVTFNAAGAPTTRTFTAKTQAVLSYATNDNAATAYSEVATPSADTGVRKLLIAIKVTPDVVSGSTQRMFADDTGGALALQVASASQKRLTVNNSTSCHFRANAPSVAGTSEMLLMTVDFTKAAVDDGVKFIANGTRHLAAASTAWDSLSGTRTVNMATVFGGGVLALMGQGNGLNLYDGKFEMFAMHWWTGAGDAIPDITDPNVQDLFSRDLIGDGTPLLGVPFKLLYFGSPGAADGTDPNTMNATGGLLNRGSIASKPLIKQAGTYI